MRIDGLHYDFTAGARKRIGRYLKENPEEDVNQVVKRLGLMPNGNHNGHKSKRPSHEVAGHQRTLPLAARS